jgi:hypothetical protein
VGGEVSSSSRALAAVVVTMLVAHELVRLSLDARRPARFGPRFWVRFGLRTVALSILVAGVAFFAGAVAETALPAWLVPLGLAAIALPLIARRVVTGSLAEVSAPALRGALALGVFVVTIAAVVLGSTARSQIESTSSDPAPPSSAVPTIEPEPLFPEPSAMEPISAFVLFIVTMLIVGAILVALRRRETTYDLDELDMSLDDSTLGLVGPGQADLEDDRIELDDEDVDRLLAQLALDIAGERDPGRAVRFAYANTERLLTELGLARDDHETEQEFLVRAIPTLGGDGPALVELTDLFERARFGHTPITEPMRERALDAVELLRRAAVDADRSPSGEGDR